MPELIEILADVDSLLDRIEGERNRLIIERTLLDLSHVDALPDPFLIEEQARSYDSLIDILERFVSVSVPRMEVRARAGDLEAAEKLRAGCQRVLNAVIGVGPIPDLTSNAAQTVGDVVRELRIVTGFGVATLVAALLVGLALRVRGR